MLSDHVGGVVSCTRNSDSPRPGTRCPRGTTARPSRPSSTFVQGDHRRSQPAVRAAGGAHRHLRPGRHAVGRASDVLAGDVLPGPRAGAGEGEAGTEERRAVQDRAVRRPRGDGEAHDEGPRKDPRRHAHRHDGGTVSGRGEEVARRRPRTRAGSGPTPNSPTSRCRKC